MKTVVLHIGTHKTGSTSIQVFMAQARSRLAEQGILYPDAGQPSRNGVVSAGHHMLAWYLLDKRNVETDEPWQHLRKEAAEWLGERLVISAEGFENLTAAHIALIQDYLAGYKLHAVVYVRNPLGYMRSAYKQRIKMGTYAKPFGDYIREHLKKVDYGSLMDRWASALGPERIHLRLFDKAKKQAGLEADFCEAIGADFEALRSFVNGPANVSPNDREIAIMRRINWLVRRTDAKRRREGWPARLRKVVQRSEAKGALVRAILGISVPGTLVSHDDIDWLRDAIGSKHETFLERYVAPEDRDLLRF